VIIVRRVVYNRKMQESSSDEMNSWFENSQGNWLHRCICYYTIPLFCLHLLVHSSFSTLFLTVTSVSLVQNRCNRDKKDRSTRILKCTWRWRWHRICREKLNGREPVINQTMLQRTMKLLKENCVVHWGKNTSPSHTQNVKFLSQNTTFHGQHYRKTCERTLSRVFARWCNFSRAQLGLVWNHLSVEWPKVGSSNIDQIWTQTQRCKWSTKLLKCSYYRNKFSGCTKYSPLHFA
jgi:hypothetical protein